MSDTRKVEAVSYPKDVSTVAAAPSEQAQAVEAARLAVARALDAVTKIPTTSPTPSAPVTESVKGDGTPNVSLPMEYEPFRYGNGLNAKAVLSVQGSHPNMTWEQGESALEKLGLRYRPLFFTSKKYLKRVEPYSREYFSYQCERGLSEARGLFDEAEKKLQEAHTAMWRVYQDVILATEAPSIDREEYWRGPEERAAEASKWYGSREWEKRRAMFRGCTCVYNEENSRRRQEAFAAQNAVNPPSEHTLKRRRREAVEVTDDEDLKRRVEVDEMKGRSKAKKVKKSM
ncbi:hypothetical protein V8F20_004390 [Naviculisporaceae sp. PSN 640]